MYIKYNLSVLMCITNFSFITTLQNLHLALSFPLAFSYPLNAKATTRGISDSDVITCNVRINKIMTNNLQEHSLLLTL